MTERKIFVNEKVIQVLIFLIYIILNMHLLTEIFKFFFAQNCKKLLGPEIKDCH